MKEQIKVKEPKITAKSGQKGQKSQKGGNALGDFLARQPPDNQGKSNNYLHLAPRSQIPNYNALNAFKSGEVPKYQPSNNPPSIHRKPINATSTLNPLNQLRYGSRYVNGGDHSSHSKRVNGQPNAELYTLPENGDFGNRYGNGYGNKKIVPPFPSHPLRRRNKPYGNNQSTLVR